ncbi:MAG: cyclic pyranopterin monophosphate synthase MoaC [Pseudomonadota bacterium]
METNSTAAPLGAREARKRHSNMNDSPFQPNDKSSVVSVPDESGRACMVDVHEKPTTWRRAVASARVRIKPEVINRIVEQRIAKGNVLAVARVAGIMAAKETARLLPLCHPLPIDSVEVDLAVSQDSISVLATVGATAKTGVEMEALTAASVAALTIYDMCKALDRRITIECVELVEKEGGRSGHFVRGREDDNGAQR